MSICVSVTRMAARTWRPVLCQLGCLPLVRDIWQGCSRARVCGSWVLNEASVACVAAIVALLIPILLTWSTRRGVSPKKLLIPLSYAGGLDGLVGALFASCASKDETLMCAQRGVSLDACTGSNAPTNAGLTCSPMFLQKLHRDATSPTSFLYAASVCLCLSKGEAILLW